VAAQVVFRAREMLAKHSNVLAKRGNDVAREPVIAGGRPRRNVKSPLTTLTLSPLKKYVCTVRDISDANCHLEPHNVCEPDANETNWTFWPVLWIVSAVRCPH
jgi:hypothetical protein